ncbi:MAG: DEAD/DEAH box helicase, partial [Lachnospiraceae bacterium]|nr:DEAD/DEAH box helicase [Lachnospiraceae bacterium]
VSVGKGRLRMEITVDPVYGRGRSLKAVSLMGSIPVTMRGNQYQYILDDRHFSRIDDEDIEKLAPYRSAANGGDTFSCVIGRKKFAEFFYRVLPEMLNADYIKVIDNIGNKAARLLPPEPEFEFYLDAGDGIVTCKPYVQYGDDRFNIIENADHFDRLTRDADQEERVKAAVGRYFPVISDDMTEAYAPGDGEYLLRILTEGVPALSQFGHVNGSDAFYRVRVRKAPQPKVQVSLESGILDLTIQTKDMSPDELIELLASYRLKKRWHRLKSGDFVDLRDTEQLRELDELADGMDISLDELVREGVKLPAYRALYLDRMLEEHEEIAASRDKHFKGLIRSYNTIRDSDFEVSGELADTLRPYQQYGFRWLSTLSQSGFGGILADEMGLGKTVQMLALLKSEYDAGEMRPSLVVCPASLVYNWKEECKRFTPGMPAVTLAGPLAQRKKDIAEAFSENTGALLITSYDLLKRDITLYKDAAFSSVILDEAQYIKNTKAAVTKSVKTLKAEHRYALTGTPIENRLSELWSIFDFLMPGFLYTSSEYTARFETPIMKGKDAAAAERLSKLTEPFILRRKKMDVLKDLPDKLEEIQSTAMEGEQRKLYDGQVTRMKALMESYGDSNTDKMRILAEITKLRQICCDPSLIFEGYKGGSAKREACLDLVRSAMDGGHRILLFSQFTSMMALLEKDLKKEGIPYFVITGATSKQERLRLVNEFNSGDTPVFLISLKAGGTGLNLTGADVVIHYDPWWNLAVQNQATDRAHRIGQTRQVTVMKLIAADSIEERIVELQEAKRDLADAIIGNQTNSLMSLSKDELMELLG